jgi:hypothetical protein
MKCRPCVEVPDNALDADKQHQVQQEFNDKQLQLNLVEDKNGKSTIL